MDKKSWSGHPFPFEEYGQFLSHFQAFFRGLDKKYISVNLPPRKDGEIPGVATSSNPCGVALMVEGIDIGR